MNEQELKALLEEMYLVLLHIAYEAETNYSWGEDAGGSEEVALKNAEKVLLKYKSLFGGS